MEWRGVAWKGPGQVGSGTARRVWSRIGGNGTEGYVLVELGMDWQEWMVGERIGGSWQEWNGRNWIVEVRQGRKRR